METTLCFENKDPLQQDLRPPEVFLSGSVPGTRTLSEHHDHLK